MRRIRNYSREDRCRERSALADTVGRDPGLQRGEHDRSGRGAGCRCAARGEKEIIIVDDGSRDGTGDWLRRNLASAPGVWRAAALDGDGDGELRLSRDGGPEAARFSVGVHFHDRNRGKGAALRTGFASATGDVVVVQDADLEYDPRDWALMLPLIVERRVADVVYGSRFFGRPHRSLYYHHYIGNRLISILFNILYNQMLSDIEVGYKMFRREVLEELHLTADDFGFEIEISAKIALARRWRIYEVGISYFGRTYDEGKRSAGATG